MNAFFNDADLKAAMVVEIEKHRVADQIISGTYGTGSNGDFRGCAIGCSVHSLARIKKTKLDTSSHQLYEDMLGIPIGLAYLEEAIFEALPDELRKTWPGRFMEAVPVGADLTMAAHQFMFWLLSDENDGVIRHAGKDADIKAAIEQAAALHAQVIQGNLVSEDQWSAAESAARIKQSEKLLQLLRESPVEVANAE